MQTSVLRNRGLFSIVLLSLHCGARLLDDLPRGDADGGSVSTSATGSSVSSSTGFAGGGPVATTTSSTTGTSTVTGFGGYGVTTTTGGIAGAGFGGSSAGRAGQGGGFGGSGFAGFGGSGFAGFGGSGFAGSGSGGRAGAAGAAGGYIGGAPPDATVICQSTPQKDDARIYCKKVVRDSQWSCSCEHNGMSFLCNSRADFPCGSTNCCGIDTRTAIGCSMPFPTIPPLSGCASSPSSRRLLCPHSSQLNIPNFGPFTACCPPTAPFSCPNGTPNSCFATADLARRACSDYCVQCQ